MATASGEFGADPSIGHCACLRQELSGEPDVGNLHLRFDEGRGTGSVLSYSTARGCSRAEVTGTQKERTGTHPAAAPLAPRHTAHTALLSMGTSLNLQGAFNQPMDHDWQRLAVSHILALLSVLKCPGRFRTLVWHDFVCALGLGELAAPCRLLER